MIKTKLLLLLVPLALLPARASATPSGLFVLGNSTSDTGNLFLATSNPPFSQPLPQDPPYFQGRFSDGPIWVDHLWQSLGLSGTPTPSFAGGTNFAVGGARTRYHSFDLTDPAFDPLNNATSFPQFNLLAQGSALIAATGGTLDASSLYTVYGGSNDVGDALVLLATDPFAASDLITRAAGDVVSVVADLVTAGAQTLLVPNIGDLGQIPEVIAQGPVTQAAATSLTQSFNDLVDAGLAGLFANIIRLDAFQFSIDLAADPTLFGLPADLNLSEPCFSGFVGEPGTVCADPANHAFWDQIHPSAVTQAVFGRIASVAVLSEAVPEPATLALVALGLVGLGGLRQAPLQPPGRAPRPGGRSTAVLRPNGPLRTESRLNHPGGCAATLVSDFLSTQTDDSDKQGPIAIRTAAYRRRALQHRRL